MNQFPCESRPKQKSDMTFTNEDKEMVACLVRHFEKELDELRNDQYGHQEIVSDMKESCREKIAWLEKLQKVMEEEPAQADLDDADPEIITDVPEADMTGGKSKPADKPHKDSWTDKFIRSMDRLTSWMLYSMLFCILIGVAGLQLSAREIVAYSLMLGLITGSINNLERVIRELFGKKED